MSLAGRRRIVEMDMWDRNAIDLEGPGFIEFAADGTGEFGLVAVHGWMDCRPTERNGWPYVEFSWDGDDEGDQVCGRGWATLAEDGTAPGTIVHPHGRRLGLPRSAVRKSRCTG
ncbi:hypothetical protein [Saccharopolyspora phatthalungensis]|uniref:Uncharacterized protein n=1 Tax=Saccharopolyspora phatthalungensis TaxID=664693 RepID=A0A840Q813_9PSEU|nr:hypothetical protein [Saccharopolyspora phatthalungensis]MBB5152933.1 hypothetical protein [Saccharopolyspora phatthalungensis]